MRVVTKSTSETVRRETAAINERLLRLEDLDDAQRAESAKRDAARCAELDDFEQADLSVGRVGSLLLAAHNEAMVADGDPVRVRTSSETSGHVLHMLGYSDPSEVWGIFLDFEPFEFRGATFRAGGTSVPMPYKRSTTVMWVDEPASEIAVALEDGLRTENRPLYGFSLGYALRQLVKTVAVVREARAAEADDPRRLTGRVRLLLNDDWVWTDYGLESVHSAERYKVVLGHFDPAGQYIHSSIRVPESRRGCTDPLWLDAINWIQEREKHPVYFGDDPPAPAEHGTWPAGNADLFRR